MRAALRDQHWPVAADLGGETGARVEGVAAVQDRLVGALSKQHQARTAFLVLVRVPGRLLRSGSPVRPARLKQALNASCMHDLCYAAYRRRRAHGRPCSFDQENQRNQP